MSLLVAATVGIVGRRSRVVVPVTGQQSIVLACCGVCRMEALVTRSVTELLRGAASR